MMKANDLDSFVEKNHYLVERFLRMNRLEVNDFYDVVIFRFLEAVSDYVNKPQLRARYTFEAVAFHAMKNALKDHYRKQNALKRRGITVELTEYNVQPYGYSCAPYTDAMRETELLREMAERLSRPQMAVIQMRVNGYSILEIAKERGISAEYVEDLLDGAHPIVRAICMQE